MVDLVTSMAVMHHKHFKMYTSPSDFPSKNRLYINIYRPQAGITGDLDDDTAEKSCGPCPPEAFSQENPQLLWTYYTLGTWQPDETAILKTASLPYSVCPRSSKVKQVKTTLCPPSRGV